MKEWNLYAEIMPKLYAHLDGRKIRRGKGKYTKKFSS
jgi:hypothetical protein